MIFSVPKTPKQTGVIERKYITLIEAARSMLEKSKLPFGMERSIQHATLKIYPWWMKHKERLLINYLKGINQ